MPSTAFAALGGALERTRQVCGLDYPFTLPRKIRGLGAARLVSTPSRTDAFRPGLARDCHFTGFPEFEQFCIAGFPTRTQVSLSPFRMILSATHMIVSD